MEPFIPLEPSVKINSAPKAFTSCLLSILIVSGIIIITLYPFNLPTIASAIPVFPLVASTKTLSLFKIPFLSAPSTMERAILSLILPAGLYFSNFT